MVPKHRQARCHQPLMGLQHKLGFTFYNSDNMWIDFYARPPGNFNAIVAFFSVSEADAN